MTVLLFDRVEANDTDRVEQLLRDGFEPVGSAETFNGDSWAVVVVRVEEP